MKSKTDGEYQQEQAEHDAKEKADAQWYAGEARAKKDNEPKGETNVKEKSEVIPFIPLSVEDQKQIYASNPDGWNKLNNEFQDQKNEALEKSRKLDAEKHEEELKRLNVKRYDETKNKPDYLCVVPGCGEDKAISQNHCSKHIRVG